ncbi:CST complex subunit STN1-like [Diadema antillarum]|uniref:CST complex subunit STN1-like n=1 Tax=Diadema antillarum TaxID=105358 RepID=UPI003A8C7229
MSHEDEYKFIPRELWSMDPVYKSYARLYIDDILHMNAYATGPADAYAYKNHPIYRVDIMGLVVSVAEREKFFHYAVDDGTGVIQTTCWKPKRDAVTREMPHPVTPGDAASELVASLQTRRMEADEEMVTPFELGDLIHVRGRIKIFRGNIEVSASFFRRIKDPTFQMEMKRMEELPILYQSVYDRPFQLSADVQERMMAREEEERLGLKREEHLVSVVKQKLVALLEDKTIHNFYLHELETVEELMETASLPCVEYQQVSTGGQAPARQIKSIFKETVDSLEREGQVFKSSEEAGLFQPTHGNKRLNDRLLDILRADCQLPKYEDGCHFWHITDRLHNMAGYEHISSDAVKEALTWLEGASAVISTTAKHYMAIS